MLSSLSATPPTRVATDPEDEIKTFYDFYLKIQKFKEEFPKLTFGFLDVNNIKTLETNARIYLDINDYLPEEEKKIILEYEKIQQRRRENKTFERSTFHVDTDAKEIVDAKRFIRQVDTIENYKKAIKRLNCKSENDPECFFVQLKGLTENFSPSNKEQIEKIEQRWKSSNYLAFLSSPSLREVAEILDQFAKYLEMITKEFISNQAYSEKFYEYYRGVSEEKKLAFTRIIAQAKQILENERYKLIQAMIARLNMQLTEILQEAAENKQSSLAFNDDVVFKTLSELREFGLPSQYISKFNPRLSLTHELSRFFFEYIINYGSAEQKHKFSELLNGQQLIQVEGLQIVGGSEPIPLETKGEALPSQVVVAQSKRTVSTHSQDLKSKVAVELQERYFEFITSAAAKYFTPQSFTNHEILQALFQQTMLEYIANNCPSEDKLNAACEEVYLHVVNGHINTLAFELFPGYVDDDLRSIFCIIAQYLFRSVRNDNFNQTVITPAQEYVVKINEAAKLIYQQISPSLGEEKSKVLQSKFIFAAANSVLAHSGNIDQALLEARMKLFVGVQQVSLKKMQIPEPLQLEFVEKCTKNLSELDVKTDNRNLLHNVNVVKDFILAKSEVKNMLSQDYVRLLKKQAWFLSVKKTNEKVEALQNALETINNVGSMQDLQTSVQTLLADKKLTQKRSIFSFFEFHSTSEKHLLSAINTIAKYRRG